MNWEKIKKEYPNVYPEFKMYYDKNFKRGADSMAFNKFLAEKGYNAYPLFIHALKDYEKRLEDEKLVL